MSIRNAFPTPKNKEERFQHAMLCYLVAGITDKLTIKQFTIIFAINYLQRGSEDIPIGEISAMVFEISRDPSWTYEHIRSMCNKMYKDGWLEKHRQGQYVSYTLTTTAKELIA